MIVLSGPSASGKTEVAKLLAKKYGIKKIITTTTRAKRIGEEDKRDYFFVSKEEFEDLIHEEHFVEYTIYNGNYYGSGKDQIGENKCVVIDIIGLKSYLALKDPKIITFFLCTAEKIRYQRMIDRGDGEESAKRRIKNDKVAFSNKTKQNVDFIVTNENNTIEEVADQIFELYTLEINKRQSNK